MRYFYKLAALFFIFCASIFVFKDSIPEASTGTSVSAGLQDATFPIVYLQLGDYTVNTLHGYSSKLDSGVIRESITPLDTSKTFTVKISENSSKIKKLDFELRDIANKKIIEKNALTAFDRQENYKTAKIKLSEGIDTSTEYGMQITLTTNVSKKINFYTRIKYYESDFNLKEKLDFVADFHNATFDGGQSLDITNYLETNTSDNSTYADVTINSNYNLITWGDLKPQIVSDVVPVIKELNVETAAIEQDYFVQIKTAAGKETFLTKEFYRIRYSGSRMYLLYFKRTMEAAFNPKYLSLKKNQFKIGVTGKKDLNITSSEDNNEFAFVRNGSLWYYNFKDNKITEVFSFEKKNNDYLRQSFDQHDIKILKFDNNGTLSFMVYGYMNCGDYEGRVGILLYDYSPSKNQLTERVYIPLSTTYEQLRHDLGDFCYVNNKNIFYFSLNDVVYAYNISSKRYTILSENAVRDNFVMLEKAKCFVWTESANKNYSDSITILNLDTSEKRVLSSKKKESIVVLGAIDANVVYGYVKNRDIYEDTNGDIIKPVYKLVISDCNGNVLREYENSNTYISEATVDDNVIRLKRLKKVNGKFKKTTPDSIMNQKSTVTPSISLTKRVTDKMLTEKYISLPSGLDIKEKPETDATKYVMVTENTTLHLDNVESSSLKYYVYAYGGITTSLTNPAKAIRLADKQMGVVMDNKSHIVWERGGKFISKELSGIYYPNSTSNSIKACTQMLLQSIQTTVDANDLKDGSIISMLSKYLDQPVNLTGCTLDEVLYFVSSGRPVIGILNNSHAVLITGYTSSTVTYMNPETHRKYTVSLNSAEKNFKNSGYTFISYISN